MILLKHHQVQYFNRLPVRCQAIENKFEELCDYRGKLMYLNYRINEILR